MKKYTVEELTAILSKYVGKRMVYTDADRERILNKGYCFLPGAFSSSCPGDGVF